MFKYQKVPKHWKYLLSEDYYYNTSPMLSDCEIKTTYIHMGRLGGLMVNIGYAWDGPSGPTVDTKSFMRGSLIHDALYQLMREGHLNRKVWKLYADKLLRKICLEDGMSKFRAWYVYNAVRLFAASSTKKR